MASFTADVLFVQFVNGLFIAAGIYLVASGLSLVFGVLGVLNFAHGSFYMYGAFFVFTWIGFKCGGFWPALLIAPLAVVILGVATEVVFLRPIYKADPLYQLLLTYGLVLMFGDAVKLIWGAENQSVARPAGLEGTIPIFGALFPSYQMFVLSRSASAPSSRSTCCSTTRRSATSCGPRRRTARWSVRSA